jgi:oligosaccharide repeat unit polymerase
LALRSSRYGLGEILTLQGLADSTNSMAVARYGGEDENLLVFLFLGFGYVAALVAPFIKLTDSRRQVWWAVLPAVTSLAYAAVSSARLGFLVSAALTVGGFIACAVIRNGVAPRVKLRPAVGVTLIGAILASAFIGIGVLRTGRVDAAVFQATLNKQSSYTVGTVGAFSTWYGDYGTGMGQQPGYGTATIAGMEYLTGQDRAMTRAYGEFAIIDHSGRKSNVYTAFRGLLLDFGIDGTIIFLGIGGFIFGWLYLSAVRGSIVAATLLGYGYASILFSGWMAMTTFTNILVVAVAAPAVLLFAKRRLLASEKRRAEDLRMSLPRSPAPGYPRNG